MRDASPVPFWLDRPRPAEAPPLDGPAEVDLAIVGAGFTGLWAAVLLIVVGLIADAIVALFDPRVRTSPERAW